MKTAIATNGSSYILDEKTHKAKKVITSFDELPEVTNAVMQMTTYQKYLKDKFPDEECTIKKDRMFFRGYRVSCDALDGFKLEDTQNRYRVIETPFDIPTPKELADFFKKGIRKFTPKELTEAAELGKQKVEEAKQTMGKLSEVLNQEIDYEKLRRKVLSKVSLIQEGREKDFDPLMFPEMIPFKRWKRKVNKVLREWKERKIRYTTVLKRVAEITEQETFSDEKEQPKFVGTLLPAFKIVGELRENKIEVDGKWVDAVPFLRDFLLHYEPKAMYQLMRFAKGEITARQFVENPIVVDRTIEYSKELPNDTFMAQVLSAAIYETGFVPPQDIVYTNTLEIGDKILLLTDEGWRVKTVRDTEEGISINRNVGLLKTDKWIKL